VIMVSMVSILLLCEGGDASPLGAASHTNNWAVLVCTSRYWFNYRHMANTLSLYRQVFWNQTFESFVASHFIYKT
jgi:glycosylphosphatidylinositol transamidase (GPIT) subunit GPI8